MKKWITLSSVMVILVIGMIWGFYAIHRQALVELGGESRNRLTLFVSNLSGTLAKYENLPRLISSNRFLLSALENDNAIRIEAGNHYLHSVATTTGASDVYLMNSNGLTVAASNWYMERSFVGKNFSFRPYFKNAIQGEPGQYFALGTTSHQRGYYFSYPVYYDAAIAGVVVIKIDLGNIEAAWSDQGNHFLVTDNDGIVFLSTRPDWTYRSIHDISSARLGEVENSRRYGAEKIHPLNITRLGKLEENLHLVKIDAPEFVSYLHLSHSMPKAGWTVHLLTDSRSIRDTLILRVTSAALAVLIVLLLVSLYIVNRQRRLALQGSTELLEKRVKKRTLELQNQVEERNKAEQTLRDTQAELIQAAKLAGLGQMSAGISHELNQPLTAIRNYVDNAQGLLERNQLEAVRENLVEVNELTQRMADIIAQLRGFSRKSSGEHSRLAVEGSIEQAISMFHREIADIDLEVNCAVEADLSVATDPVLLNQVLVNLLSNAIQAMAQAHNPRLDISACKKDDAMLLVISDTGPGISDEVIDNIFDPFFTTKEVGLGLGLGLSISYRIMESLGGRIEVSNNAACGACFELYLPDE
ncbi:MAG: sensor histidine kinase [Gammaproteobacteria bacterium]|nr:sensor histidine kinase [Gammaproteobacteria bacterium]